MRGSRLAQLALALLAQPDRLAAQFSLSPVAGAMQYDAAFDDNYFAWGLQARYYISPSVRVGVLGSTAHVGYPVRGGVARSWMLPSSDETVWRAGAFAEVAAVHPFRNSRVPVVDQLTLSARALLGVFHSSGVDFDYDAGAGDPFYGITDTPTGVAYGGGIGLEFGPYGQFRATMQANVWRDHAYGGVGFDPEVLFGLAVDL